jgi:hypothetical protein
MTDNLQLQTARLTNANVGNLIDNSITDIENAVSVLFGITKDTPISPVMSITAGGNVTMVGDLILSGAPTADAHCATKLYADDNTGGGGGITHKVEAVLVTDQEVTGTGNGIIAYDYAPVEDGSTAQWDSGAPTKLVCKSAGDYLIYGQIEIGQPSNYAAKPGVIDLLLDGAAIHEDIFSYYSVAGHNETNSFAILYTLAENEYLELKVYAPELDLTVVGGYQSGWQGGTMFGMMKVG